MAESNSVKPKTLFGPTAVWEIAIESPITTSCSKSVKTTVKESVLPRFKYTSSYVCLPSEELTTMV